jgi:signal transduction histidine kinase
VMRCAFFTLSDEIFLAQLIAFVGERSQLCEGAEHQVAVCENPAGFSSHNPWVMLTEERDVLCLSIDDDGPGIAAPDMKRVFEPCVRLEASRSHETGGVGLGMTIAHSIVRGHGDDITLTNRPEGGLRVAVHVPIVLSN